MSHKIVIEVNDDRLWKALCGASTLVKRPVSGLVTDLVNMNHLVKRIAESLSTEDVKLIVEEENLHIPFADLMVFK